MMSNGVRHGRSRAFVQQKQINIVFVVVRILPVSCIMGINSAGKADHISNSITLKTYRLQA